MSSVKVGAALVNSPTNPVLLWTMSARVVVQRASFLRKLDFLPMHSAVDVAMLDAIQTKRVLLHTMNAKENVVLDVIHRRLDCLLMRKCEITAIHPLFSLFKNDVPQLTFIKCSFSSSFFIQRRYTLADAHLVQLVFILLMLFQVRHPVQLHATRPAAQENIRQN
jgi:hypothetical protein